MRYDEALELFRRRHPQSASYIDRLMRPDVSFLRFIKFFVVGALFTGANALLLFIFSDKIGFDAWKVSLVIIPSLFVFRYFTDKKYVWGL